MRMGVHVSMPPLSPPAFSSSHAAGLTYPLVVLSCALSRGSRCGRHSAKPLCWPWICIDLARRSGRRTGNRRCSRVVGASSNGYPRTAGAGGGARSAFGVCRRGSACRVPDAVAPGAGTNRGSDGGRSHRSWGSGRCPRAIVGRYEVYDCCAPRWHRTRYGYGGWPGAGHPPALSLGRSARGVSAGAAGGSDSTSWGGAAGPRPAKPRGI